MTKEFYDEVERTWPGSQPRLEVTLHGVIDAYTLTISDANSGKFLRSWVVSRDKSRATAIARLVAEKIRLRGVPAFFMEVSNERS